jgi:dTDP-4-amino-4,6-dideoxygalactose transaminase
MPSYTFVSTANAFVLRGAVPVFVDVRPDTLNIDERLIEAAITPRTRAIVPVHYAGVACEMDAIMDIARRHDLLVIEDAAQAVMASYKGRPLGAIGTWRRCPSTRPRTSSPARAARCWSTPPALPSAPRSSARRAPTAASSSVARWTNTPGWMWARPTCPVSSLPPSCGRRWRRPTTSPPPSGHLEHLPPVVCEAGAQGQACVDRSSPHCRHNAHMYYLLLPSLERAPRSSSAQGARSIQCVFHYIPLHSAPAGRRYGRAQGELAVTQDVSDRLLRLPLWIGIEDQQAEVIRAVGEVLRA